MENKTHKLRSEEDALRLKEELYQITTKFTKELLVFCEEKNIPFLASIDALATSIISVSIHIILLELAEKNHVSSKELLKTIKLDELIRYAYLR